MEHPNLNPNLNHVQIEDRYAFSGISIEGHCITYWRDEYDETICNKQLADHVRKYISHILRENPDCIRHEYDRLAKITRIIDYSYCIIRNIHNMMRRFKEYGSC